MTYSLDLRKKVLKYIESGKSWSCASQAFGVAIRTVANWLKRKKQSKLPAQERPKGSYKIQEDRLRDFIAKNPDAYLREIAEEFKTTTSAVFYACNRNKITLKKRRPITRKEAAIYRGIRKNSGRKSRLY